MLIAPPAHFCVDQLIPLDTLESAYLAWAIQRLPGGRRVLAEALGVSPRTLFRKMTQVPTNGDPTNCDK